VTEDDDDNDDDDDKIHTKFASETLQEVAQLENRCVERCISKKRVCGKGGIHFSYNSSLWGAFVNTAYKIGKISEPYC